MGLLKDSVFSTRYERKFILNVFDAEFVKSRIRTLLDSDINSFQKGSYPVFNLYFDTSSFDFYSDKVEGEFSHAKCRMRTYTLSPNEMSKWYFEVKSKNNAIGHKYRLGLRGGLGSGKSTTHLSQIPEARDMVMALGLPNLVQTCGVFYEREAYQAMVDGSKFRINFDSNFHLIGSGQLW